MIPFFFRFIFFLSGGTKKFWVGVNICKCKFTNKKIGGFVSIFFFFFFFFLTYFCWGRRYFFIFFWRQIIGTEKLKLCNFSPILAIRPSTRSLHDLQKRVFRNVTDRRTLRLYDCIGPVDWFSEIQIINFNSLEAFTFLQTNYNRKT